MKVSMKVRGSAGAGAGLVIVAFIGAGGAWAGSRPGAAPEAVPIPSPAVPAAAQEAAEKEAVLAVVQRFFDTMTSKDVAGARETLIIDGVFSSVRPSDDGALVRTAPFRGYIEGLEEGARLQEERMWEPVVMIHDRLAVVWTPYDFHNDGELSHCGIDAFNLIKTDSGWRIANAAYTVEPDGCAALGQPPRRSR